MLKIGLRFYLLSIDRKMKKIFINTIFSYLIIVVFNLILNFIGKNCPYQNRCSFAHGQEELRASQMPPVPMGGMEGYMGGYMGGYDMGGADMYGGQQPMYPPMMGGFPPMQGFDPNMQGGGLPQPGFGMPPTMGMIPQ
jgi:hypothetical protein